MIKIQPDETLHSETHNTFCPLPYTKLILNSYGHISMCCHQQVQLGVIDENTDILKVWKSDLAKEIRRATDKGDLHSSCKAWNSCPFLVKERVLNPVRIFKKSAYPTYLEICLPDKHCNVGGENPSPQNPACIMCRRNFNIPDQKDMTDLMCEKSKPLMPYLKHLCVLGIAEPFWKDAVFKIFEKLEFHRYKDQIEFTTNTNGICLNEKTANRFFEEVRMSDLSWSLDSATAETHQKIRRLDTFHFVISNLNRWIKLREKHGGKKSHKVCIYNNINLLNVHEMTQMVELAHATQVDHMVMLPTYDQFGVVSLHEICLNDKNVKVFKQASEKAMRRAEELGVQLLYSKRFDVVPPAVTNAGQELVQLQLDF